ncbi:MAG: aminodeoxychorismate synthase component I [Pseudomonadota bacterium]
MRRIEFTRLDYQKDSVAYVDALMQLDLDKPIFLDSNPLDSSPIDFNPEVVDLSANPIIAAHSPNEDRRFDIISAAPDAWLSLTYADHASALSRVRAFFETHDHSRSLPNECAYLPFCGGIIANINYEFGYACNELTPLQRSSSDADSSDSLFCAGLYTWAIIQDHQRKEAHFVTFSEHAAHNTTYLDRVLAVLDTSQSANTDNSSQHRIVSPIESHISQTDYLDAIARIHEYILSGDCYQVNFAQSYSGRYSGSTWSAYKQLRSAAQAPFSAYWQCEHTDVLCASPERFLRIDQHRIETKPIKGTRPRSHDPVEDKLLADALSQSIKDCAENLMIVDLLRNDLGKNCVPGSIEVERLFDVESFSTVHHLVSTISGTLSPDRTHLDTFLDCFPGGSITGAPKIRAMQIINELEQHERQLYCGSIAYFSAHGHSDSNICIRTFLCNDGHIRTWAGGGIVHDSNPAKEYAECGYKIDALIHSLTQSH